MGRHHLLLLLLLFLPPVAYAGAVPWAHVAAPTTVVEGAADIVGDLAGFQHPRELGDPAGAVSFIASAERLRIEWDQINHAVHPDVATQLLDTREQGGVPPLHDALLVSEAPQPNAILMVYPTDGAHVTASIPNGTVTAGAGAVSVEHFVAETGQDRSATTPHHWLGLAGTGATNVTVTGDFMVSLYAWNVTATTSDGGEQEIWSGSRSGQSTSDPLAPNSDAGGQTRQTYLYFEGGSITIEGVDPDAAHLLFADLQLESHDATHFLDALAEVGDGKRMRELGTQNLRVSGEATLAGPVVAGQGGTHWAVQVTGEELMLEADGQTLAWAAPMRDPQKAEWITIVAVGALLAWPVLQTGRKGLELEKRHALARMEAHVAAGRPARAHRLTWRRGWGRFATDAWVLGAQSLADDQRCRQADAFIDARAPPGHDPRVAAFLHAYARARDNDVAGTLSWLERMGDHPELAAEVRVHPAFSAVRHLPGAPAYSREERA